jgi:hypothetical protein
MALRLIIFLIPLLTWLVPARWFSFYATLGMMVAAVQIVMIILLREQYTLALSSFGLEVVVAYIFANLTLLGVRYHYIRRARARITKLPAPTTKEEK